MIKHLKRFLALVIVLAAAVFLIIRIKGLLQYPHLYLDLGRITLRNAAFLGGGLLSLALAVVFGIYLFFNADGRIPDILLSLLLCGGLGVACFFLTEQGLIGIPCTYTTSPADYQTEFRRSDFFAEGLNLYPEENKGILNAYAYYENGDVRWQRVIRSFGNSWGYKAEVRRLDRLGLDFFEEDDWSCYELRSGDTVWQVQADDKTRQVIYSRYDRADQKPGVAPDLLEPTPEESESLLPIPIPTARPTEPPTEPPSETFSDPRHNSSPPVQ